MESPIVSVIIPTYREAENLSLLVPRIAAVLEAADLPGEIIVVDDNSPDDTVVVCERLAQTYPLRLEVRTAERGLSSAVIHGMRAARGEILVVMDADLSHPPEKVPELVEAVRTGDADFVIGSRYVPGGGTADDWGLFRWLNSRVATLLAWPLTSAHDPLAGFFALRRSTFAHCALELNPVGYKIGLELIVKGRCRSVREVPILFRDRVHGESKLTVKEQVNYLRHLKRLYEYRYGTAARLVQFGLIGLSGAVIDLASLAVLLMFAPPTAARALAIWIAMTWNFVLNRRLTFSYARDGSVVRQYLLFVLSCSAGALANWGTSLLLMFASPAFARHPLLAAAIGIVVGAGFNYVLCATAVFRPSRREELAASSSAGVPRQVQQPVPAGSPVE